MRVAVSWLRELVDADLDDEALVEALTRLGVEVEGRSLLGEGAEGVVARVEGLDAHPAAPHLRVARLAWPEGTGWRRATVVTSATNVRPGDLVPLARPGDLVPGRGRVQAEERHGVLSEGMMLSADELGLGPERDGILVLPPDGIPGRPLAQALSLPETVLEVSITPNMAAFAQSMVGLARELAAATGGRLTWRSPREPAVGDIGRPVRVEDPEDCPRYVLGAAVEVRAESSPFWLRRRLWAAGVRSHDRVVDVTNYVLLELGQPLHAFDADRVAGGVTVRRAREGERTVTLDGEERLLTAEDLVIADEEGVAAVAGVMGALRTQVTAATRRVLLEGAIFRPARVRRTARRLGLATEASGRFERGVDPSLPRLAVGRALELLQAVEGARPVEVVQEVSTGPVASRLLRASSRRVSGLLGIPLSAQEVASRLTRLGLPTAVRPEEEEDLQVEVPPRRADVEAEADLAEEVARLEGLDRIPASLPRGVLTRGEMPPLQRLIRQLREWARGAGFSEAVCLSLIGPEDLRRTGWPEADAVRVLNPLREEGSLLRPGLLPGLLRVLAYHRARGVEDVHLVEVGRVFRRREGEAPEEVWHLGLLACGPVRPSSWLEARPPAWEVFAMKGLVQALLARARVPEVTFRPAAQAHLHPGRSLEVFSGEKYLGSLGELHPGVLRAWELAGPVAVAELSVDALLDRQGPLPKGGELPRFPGVVRDLAVVLPDGVRYEAAREAVVRAGGPYLEEARLFDRYVGPQLPSGHHSLAFRLVFRAQDRTLTDEEADEALRAIRQSLAALGGKVRGEG